jgi:hypothetical protein
MCSSTFGISLVRDFVRYLCEWYLCPFLGSQLLRQLYEACSLYGSCRCALRTRTTLKVSLTTSVFKSHSFAARLTVTDVWVATKEFNRTRSRARINQGYRPLRIRQKKVWEVWVTKHRPRTRIVYLQKLPKWHISDLQNETDFMSKWRSNWLVVCFLNGRIKFF